MIPWSQVRSVMAGGCYSDHLLVIKAYEKWQVAKREGNEATFVRDNFLHRGTLHMIEGQLVMGNVTV